MDSAVTYRSDTARRLINAEAVLDAIADQVLSDGNVDRALQRLFRFGTEDDIGLLDILDRLREASQETEPKLQTADQHAGESEIALSERRRDDSSAMREALRQVESLDDLLGIDPELMQRSLTTEELDWVEKWAEMTGQMIEAGLVITAGDRLQLTSKAIRRIGSQLLKHMFLPPKQSGRGDHLVHRSGNSAVSGEEVVAWEWGRPFDVHITRTLANALRRQQESTSLRITVEDFEVFDRESGAAVVTVLLIDMSRSMFDSGAWDAAKRSAVALNTLYQTTHSQDRLVIIGFSGDARALRVEELPALSWDQFSHGTNLQAGLIAAARELDRYHGKNRQVVIITDGEPTAFMDGDTPTFEHPVTDLTLHATLREARRLAKKNVAITLIRVEETRSGSDFAETFLRTTAGRLIDVPMDSLGSFLVRDIASGVRRAIR